MRHVKHTFNDTITLQEAVEWCHLAGIDEVIQDVAQNNFIPVSLKPATFLHQTAPTTTPNQPKIAEISFDSCDTLDDLEKMAAESAVYNTLSKTASHMLFGEGSSTAKIMVIADQPDREEDISNQLFCSKKGKLIRTLMARSGVNEDDTYYTYLSKWRPPGGRKLSDSEQKNLSNLLIKHINIIKPQTVVTLGEIALHALIEKTGFNFRKNAGKIHSLDNEAFDTEISLLPLFHEESLLKNPQLKKAIWLGIVNCKGDLIRQ